MKALIKLALSNKRIKKALPIASNLLFRDGFIYATNLDIAAVSNYAVNLTMSKDAVIPANIVKAALLVNKHLTIQDNKINGIPFDEIDSNDFPINTDLLSPPSYDNRVAAPFPFNGKIYKDLLPAAAKEDIRYYLNGIFLDFKEHRITATDGHRLHTYNSDSLPSIDMDNIPGYIMNRDSIELALLSKSDTIEIFKFANNEYIATYGPECRIVSKIIDGKFPDINRVTPDKKDAYHIRVDNSSLLKALKLIKSAIDSKNNACLINASIGQVSTPNGFTQAFGSSRDRDNPALEKIGFNVDYLIDTVKTLDNSMSDWYFHTVNDSVLIEENNFKSIVMPMRV